ncbi:DNA-directed RNA polymerase subunit alpha C-terminal domain-containing protein [Sporosarcina sp. 179-K 3D1 HS]|uniref:DNA-directed RNA polymerase subunit alpha C-terminal domain-containing protein n=1 Tax=Sporosarcina sp. 179-K 3D1 HS TaxID=3232169 RepID=UPI00399F6495
MRKLRFDKENYEDEPIELLDASIRLYNILKRNQIHTIGDLMKTKNRLNKDGFGPVSQKELAYLKKEIELMTFI